MTISIRQYGYATFNTSKVVEWFMWDAKWRIKVTYFEDSTHNLSFYDAEYDASSPSDVKYACEVYVKSDGFGGMLLEDYLMRMFRGQTLNEYLNTKGGP